MSEHHSPQPEPTELPDNVVDFDDFRARRLQERLPEAARGFGGFGIDRSASDDDYRRALANLERQNREELGSRIVEWPDHEPFDDTPPPKGA